ncbi:MAG: MATE family efflux transporter [Clostridia bacterium]|nr:MATE family efflux transporter [Clostridia bacterium]
MRNTVKSNNLSNDNSKNQNPMGTFPIFPLIVKMSLPAMFSMFIQAFYNIVDSIYVSRLGETSLSAITLIFPIQLLSIAISVGTSVGLSSLISRRLGENRQKDADLTASHGVFLGVCSWVVFAIFGLFFSKPFVSAFSEDPAIVIPAASYCMIICMGSLFVFIAINAEKIMQGTGNMLLPMACALSGAVTNIILDPIFIFGYFGVPAMGVTGAAIATIIGQFIAMVLAVTFLFTKNFPVKIHIKGFRPNKDIIKNIYAVGFPSIIMQSVASILTLGLNALLIQFSATAVAVLGVYYKVQTFVFLPVFGMVQGLMPVLGYNYGAKNKARVKSAFYIGLSAAMSIMILGTLIFHAFPAQIMSMFKAEGELLRMGIIALKTISLCFPFAAIGILISIFFQATGHGFFALVSSVMRQLVFLLPLAYFFAYKFGLDFVWWAYLMSDVIATIVSVFLLKKIWNREINEM